MADLDDLLRPTLTDAAPRPKELMAPYRVSSQGYVAFFGGVLAVSIVALVNARRLQMPLRPRLLMAGVGALAVAGEVIAATLITGDQSPRIIRTLAALAAFGVLYWLQRSPERVYSYHATAEEPFESLLPLGFALCIHPGLVELALLGQL